MMNADFYMCYVDGGSAPTVRHSTREIARKEAERLTRSTKRTTYVLRAESECVVSEPPVEHRDLDEIPF